jgi:hypothetical protein
VCDVYLDCSRLQLLIAQSTIYSQALGAKYQRDVTGF